MLTKELEETLSFAVDQAVKHKHEFVTLEHLLYALLEDSSAARYSVPLRGEAGRAWTRRSKIISANVLEKMPESSQAHAGADLDVSVHDPVRRSPGRGQRPTGR